MVTIKSNPKGLILGLKKAINPNEDLSKFLIHSDQGILYQSLNIVTT